jgi:hypothetical protein
MKNISSLLNIIKVSKSRNIRWAGNVERMGQKGNLYKFCSQNVRCGDNIKVTLVEGNSVMCVDNSFVSE